MMSALSTKRVWSLWEMMELILHRFTSCLNFLRHEETREDWSLAPPPPDSGTGTVPGGLAGGLLAGALIGDPPKKVSDENKHTMDLILALVETTATILEMQAALDRVERFKNKLQFNISPNDYRSETKTLRETLEDGAKTNYCFSIKRQRAELVLGTQNRWAPTLKAFPSAQKDIFSAMEAHAIDLHTACVFHLMRVTEYGLRALAKERRVALPKNKQLEWANWNEIIVAARKRAEHFKNRPAGPARDKAVHFYEGVLGEFEAFKDVHRNDVMHTRAKYDEHQAESVILHVPEFMNRLSAKLTENPKAIKWGRI